MGRVFAEFEVGQRFVTPGRTVTEADIVAYAALTGDHNPVHTDAVFSAATAFGSRVAHGPMGIGLAFGLASRLDLIDGTVVALLGVTWAFTAPMRPGDTVRAVIEVVETRATRHPERGVVGWAISIVGDRDRVLQTGTAQLLVSRTRPDAARWGLVSGGETAGRP